MMRKTRMEVTECKNSFAIRIYCFKKRSHKKPKKQLSRCGGKIEENPKREIKRRIKAPLKRKRLTPSGEKKMRKNKDGSNRMQKQLRHSDLLYQK